MRQVHRAGEKSFIDFSGKRPSLVDRRTGELRSVELFVAVLGASSLTYAEATATQQLAAWVNAHLHMVDYFGGATTLWVPDQLKSAIAPLDQEFANYAFNCIEISPRSSPRIVLHELSHLLEADGRTFRRALGFLARRTAGDPLQVVDSRGSLGRRDAWRRPDGRLDLVERYYPGRVYAASRRTDDDRWHRATLPGSPGDAPARQLGDQGDVDVYATEVLSSGVEWLWEDPVAFAAADPEYFDFIWVTVVRGIR